MRVNLIDSDEDLIKHGWEEDVWFHVDNMSSAHVYLRMNDGQVWDNLPEALLTDLAQLTKANSIQGSKQDNIVVIYTPWSNLKKTDGMETGQVSFHKKKLVKQDQKRGISAARFAQNSASEENRSSGSQGKL